MKTKSNAKTRSRRRPTSSVNSTCATKRRRGRAAIQELRDQLREIVNQYDSATCRQIFYQAVSRGLIEKTEGEYRRTICRLLLAMRRDGEIGYDRIADGTRWMRKPTTHSSLASMLTRQASMYRHAVWDEQPVYCELWVEKDALAGVLSDITYKWDVPLYPARGFSSESFLYSAAENIRAEGKPAYIYYFGDRDPSGVLIDKAIERGLRRLAPDCDIIFRRVAVTPDQIEEYDLPTRPTKRDGNTHARTFKGDSVELDAIDPVELRRLADRCIVQHIDHDAHGRMLQVEEAERETLRQIAERLEGAA